MIFLTQAGTNLGPTKKLAGLIEVTSQWDETGMADEALSELVALRRMARVLIASGVDWDNHSSGEFIEAVKLLKQLAVERPTSVRTAKISDVAEDEEAMP